MRAHIFLFALLVIFSSKGLSQKNGLEQKYESAQKFNALVTQYLDVTQQKDEVKIKRFVNVNKNEIKSLYQKALKDYDLLQSNVLKGKTQKTYDAEFYDYLLKNGAKKEHIEAFKQVGGPYAILSNHEKYFKEIIDNLNVESISFNNKLNTAYVSATWRTYHCIFYFLGAIACGAIGAAPCAIGGVAAGYGCLARAI